MHMRRSLLGPLLLIALLAIGYGGYWLYASHALEEGFARWRAAREAEGYTVGHGDLRVAGFPFAVQLVIAAPRVASAAGEWQWAGMQVTVEFQPWDLRRYRAEAVGPHTLDARVDGRRHHLSVEAATALFIGRAQDDGRFADGALHLADLDVRDQRGRSIVTAEEIRADARRASSAGAAGVAPPFDLTLSSKAVTLDPALRSPLGSEIATLEAVGQILGDIPRDFSRTAVELWRRDGGSVRLALLRLVWGALDLRASGTVTVDEKMRPLGAVTAEIRGYRALVAALEQARLLRRNEAAASRLALDLLSQRDRAGGGRVVTVPMTAQTGALFLGPVRLMGLPPIAFPARSG